jgi:stress-induced morphogen
MKIKWNIDNGYVHRCPDFEVEIDDEDLEGMTEAERDRYIDEIIQDEFFAKCSLTWKVD